MTAPSVPPEGEFPFRQERVCAALDEIAVRRSSLSPKGAPDGGLRAGFFGVRYDEGRLLCRYDPAVADVEAWRTQLREEVGEDSDLVDYVPATRSALRLAELFDEVCRRQWHPLAALTGMSALVDMDREVVVVNLGRDAPREVVDALRALGDELDVSKTFHGRRRSERGQASS